MMRAFFLVFSLLLFVPGCVTMQDRSHVIIPVDQFPAFIVPQGQDVEPASDENAVRDIDILALSEEIRAMLDESILQIGNPKQRWTHSAILLRPSSLILNGVLYGRTWPLPILE
jgi:hypothetical protein